ncbi:hypothetical protein PFC_04005 [Pyrococcus furiosus COM1]|nr:hypothetical protein PFC_04005 [Pyrococcus furiosus COM1]
MESREIPPQLASQIAQTYVNWIATNIPEFKNWKNATIGEPTRVHMP